MDGPAPRNHQGSRLSKCYGSEIPSPTWFENETVARAAAEGSATPREPMHGLRLIIKEDALPLREQPKFEALTELQGAASWQLKRGKATATDQPQNHRCPLTGNCY